MGHFVPVTWMSWILDYRIFGPGPFGFHLTNLVVHTACATLLYVVARRLLAAAGLAGLPLTAGAVVAGVFFGVHPLRAETVAWVTERRGLLSGALVLATVLAWLEAAGATGRRRLRWLGLAAAGLVLAFLAKSTAMVLPLALVILDVYPLRRLAWGRRRGPEPGATAVWREKAPFLAIALAGGIVAYLAQEAGSPNRAATVAERVRNVAFTLWFHLSKQIVPSGLSPLHEWPDGLDPRPWRFVVAFAGVATVSVLVVLLRRRWPAGLAAWAYHGVALLPVLGLFPLGDQLTAERYSYLPSLGWALLVGGSVGGVLAGAGRGQVSRRLATLLAGVVAVWLLWLASLGSAQARVWHDSATLWRHAAVTDPACWRCREAWGDVLRSQGQAGAAQAEYRAALALNPGADRVGHALGLSLASQGRFAEAVDLYRPIARRSPGHLGLAIDLAVALRAMGRPDEAVAAVRTGVEGFGAGRARQLLPRLLEVEGTRAIGQLGLLEACRRLGLDGEARAAGEALATLDPELSRAAAR